MDPYKMFSDTVEVHGGHGDFSTSMGQEGFSTPGERARLSTTIGHHGFPAPDGSHLGFSIRKTHGSPCSAYTQDTDHTTRVIPQLPSHNHDLGSSRKDSRGRSTPPSIVTRDTCGTTEEIRSWPSYNHDLENPPRDFRGKGACQAQPPVTEGSGRPSLSARDSGVSFGTEYTKEPLQTPSTKLESPWVPEENKKWIRAGKPVREGRNIILLFDGTGDSFDSTNSNVVRLTSYLRKDDTTSQLVYYQTGIGTTIDPWIVTPMVAKTSKVLDTMFAFTLDSHMRNGYKFLMDNYTTGDKICIFGFSRGAYTARALAGMLRKVGLLSRGNAEHLPFAYNMYKRDDDNGELMSRLFKATFSIDVKIEFVGVWDTVASTGLVTRDLPFVGTNDGIRVFRHALALDERRGKFIPTYYRQSQGGSISTTETEAKTTDVKEVWFAGAHCDVGGGSVRNTVRHNLARIPLRWMIRECFRTNIGIIFDSDLLHDDAGLDLVYDVHGNPYSITDKPLPPKQSLATGDHEVMKNPPRQTFFAALVGFVVGIIVLPYSLFFKRHAPPEEAAKEAISEGEAEEELKDAVQPVYDQMEMKWFWRFIGFIPFRAKKYNVLGDGADTYQWIWNLGQGRKIYQAIMERGKVKIHKSVKIRLEAQDAYGNANCLPYAPKVRPNLGGLEEPQALPVSDWNVEQSAWFEWEE